MCYTPLMAREKQRGRALQRVEGDLLHIVFADRGQRTMKIHIKHYQHRPRDGFGSHQNGRHKLG